MQGEIQKQFRMMPGQEKFLMEYYQKNPSAVAKIKTKKKKTKLVKVSRKKSKTKKKVATKRVATKKPSKVSKKNNKLKNKKSRERGKKMSTETIKAGKSPLLDTSHLKVKFPYKEKYGNYIGGKFV